MDNRAEMSEANPSPARHMLSFDVEEYFQVEAAAAGVRREDWDSYERRVGPAVEQILELLAEHRASATFFVLGWVARHQPRVVRSIAKAGHEIASHGMNHSMIGRMGRQEFRRDVTESRKVLEDLSGRSVLGYRAPTFSIMHPTAWALDVLAEAGFVYDSSIFPVHHDRYGVPEAPRFIHHAIGPSGGRLLEIPPLTLRALGANWPVGGGGYLRLLPISVIGHGLRRFERLGRPGMLYLHPWELDPRQPHLPMRRLSRFRHRINLHKTHRKLGWLLARRSFCDVRGQIEQLQASASESHTYGRQ